LGGRMRQPAGTGSQEQTMRTYEHLFLGGDWREARTPDWIEVISPAGEQPVGRVPDASRDGAGGAVEIARQAVDHCPSPRLRVARRISHVARFAAEIRARGDELADILCAEVGLPRRTLPTGQIAKADAVFTAFTELAAAHPWEATRPGTG